MNDRLVDGTSSDGKLFSFSVTAYCMPHFVSNNSELFFLSALMMARVDGADQ